jgi:hypothetical protein
MKKLFVAVAMFGMVSSASAASLVDVNGSVMVNKGKGFVPAVGTVKLSVGDKVLVGEGGFAAVTYDKCTVSLDKPTVHAVSKVAPCDQAVISPVADLDPPIAAGLGGLPLTVLLPLLVIPPLVGCALIDGCPINDLLDDENDPAT